MKSKNSSKLRQESAEPKLSNKLRRDPPPKTSGQLVPKLEKEDKKKQAARDDKRLVKSKFRAEKSDARLDRAKEKLSKQKPYKPPTLSKRISAVAAFELRAQAHQKVRESDNTGVESAHSIELTTERIGHAAVRHIKHTNRTRPARRVRKLEKKNIKANADYHKQASKKNTDTQKRQSHKKRTQKQFRKRTKQTAKRGASNAAREVNKTRRAVWNFVKRNPKVMVIVALCMLPILLIQSCTSVALSLFSGLGGAVLGTSYLAEDEELDDAEFYYKEWETDLLLEAQNAEITHAGYDEYRYEINKPYHDPYALIAYLTVKYDDFTFWDIQPELLDIFNEQYSLTFTPSVEIRYRSELRYYTWVDYYGQLQYYSYWEDVPYEWHILTVTLTAQSFESVVMPRLTTQEEQERYEVYMLIKGNRQYIGNPLGFYWLPYVSSNYGYRVHPISGVKSYHTGVDIALPEGTPIYAGGTGTVLEAADKGGYGLAVVIDYGDGISGLYAHCSALLVSAGQTVQTGDVIALSGNTGNSTGAHLHMEVIKNGRYLNPLFFVDGTIDY